MKTYFPTLFFSMFIFGLTTVQAQIGIGTTSPSSSSILDVQSDSKGILIPRLALEITTAATPVNNPENGLMVYNTKDTNDVKPGFYYWEDTEWLKIQDKNDVSIVNTTSYTGLTDGDTTPVPVEGEGIIVFSDPHFFGWDGTKWVQLD